MGAPRWCALVIVTLAVMSCRGAWGQTAGSAATDAAALLALKRAATNAKFSSWAGDEPCGAQPWQYITCTQRRVVALELGGKGIAGTLPAELAAMDQLQLLSLGGNAFSGKLPAAWGRPDAFPLLVSLDLKGNLLTGTLPPTWAELGAFRVLQRLVLDDNQLSGPLPQRWGEASAFQLLTTLSIAGNALDGTLPPTWCNDMTSLPAIQVLSLERNQLAGPLPGFWGGQGCKQMRSLSLGGNQLGGGLPANWAAQGYWPSLTTLQLQGNTLQGGLPAEWTAPTAFPAMRTQGSGIIVQPGNAGLSGTVPFIQFPLLARTADGKTARIPNLKDPELAAVRPPPAPNSPPPPDAAALAAARPATVTAVVSLAGSGLWPFTPLQQAALSGVVLQSLSTVESDITEAQLTIGTAKRSTGVVAQYANISKKGRRLLQDAQSIEVPIYVLTTVGKAAAVRTALAVLAKSAALQADLRSAGFQLSDAGLVSINSSLGDQVPPAVAAPEQALAPAPVQTGSGSADSSSSGSSGSSANTGSIVGGVVGGLAALLLIGAVGWACIRRRQQDRQAQFITQRMYRPSVRRVSNSSSGMPYRKSSLATVQESQDEDLETAAGHRQPGSPGGSSRSGRLTQGLYRTSSNKSTDGNLLDQVRSGSAHCSSCIEPVYVVPAAEAQAQQSGSGRSARLTQSTLGAHTRITNPEDSASSSSWTSRFSRAFARS